MEYDGNDKTSLEKPIGPKTRKRENIFIFYKTFYHRKNNLEHVLA